MSPVAQVLEALPLDVPSDRRLVVALAGPPAAGKSTLADALVRQLDPRAVVLGLDAFHYDDAVLNERGHRARKGAPHTFDVDGYRACLERLASTPDRRVALPVFDRSLELTRNAAVVAEPHHRVVVTEGNWLLLDEDGWRELTDLFDLTVFVTTDRSTIRRRILERWASHGFDADEAQRRADVNDLPNADTALEQSLPADLTVHT